MSELNAGRYAAAAAGFRALVDAEPRHAAALHFLGLALHQQGQSEAGLAAMQQALALQTQNPLYWNNLAGVLDQMGRSEEAERAYREALALKPDYAGCHVNLGMLYAGRGDHPRALLEFARALDLDAQLFAAWRGRAASLLQLARRGQALQAYQHAMQLAAGDVDGLLSLGAALREAGALEEAQRCYARAAELAPDAPQVENGLGNLSGMQGDLAGAERHYRRALARKPGYVSALHNLADVKTLGPADPLWAELMALAERRDLPAEDAVPLQFTLGRVWEAQGEYARAFSHLATGNRLKRSSINYDEARQARFFRDFMRLSDAASLAARQLLDSADPRPVFIVGMPRSGTSLVEQILASHPLVHGAGETHALRNALREELPPERGDYGLPEALAGLGPEALSRAAARYSRYLDELAPGAARVTNKLPGNMALVGLIHLLYPKAVIIHCRRDPLDTGLSCYSKLFTTGHPFSYELTELGRFQRMAAELMQHWATVLPGRMLELQYETLVADFEPEVRRLLAHCGLPWDAACLRFHESSRAVRTASLAQVRRPLYADSVGRWKLYEKELAPLKAALEESQRGGV